MENEIKIRPGLDIAVVGMAGRFPHAANLEDFWKNLRSGLNSVTRFSDEMLKEAGVEASLYNDPRYVKANVILEEADKFDAAFFDYPPVEAEALDPQMRLFQECVWHALEDAGCDTDRFDGLIGMYSGAKSNAYWAALSMLSGKNETLGYFAATQYSNKDSQSTLVSYKLNLRGPSFTLQTACSTSLVAIHLGCQALLNGECDLAVAGGANINMPQTAGYLFQEGMLYSSDGYCRTFDAKADGSIFGSGIGAVVLKRAEDAVADRDHIYAIIKGSAINNDGNRKPGFTAPSVEGQRDVVIAAHQIAGVDPESITYVETHGTATTLGDPVEVEGLKQAFQTSRKAFCGLGSVKTNIGHLDAAAGVAGFIKTVLAIRNREIPPTLNFERPNPKIDFIDSPFFINTELRPWITDGGPIRAGVSTFGVGGTNAHIVLEEPPVVVTSASSRKAQPLCLSARTATALQTMAKNLADFIETHPEASLADVAFTLGMGRKAFSHRRCLLVTDQQDAIVQLRKEEMEGGIQGRKTGKKEQGLCLAFGNNHPVDAATIADFITAEPLFGPVWNELRSALGLPVTVGAEQDASISSFCFALAQGKIMLNCIGGRPVITGWGSGLWTAACIAGVMTPADVISLHRLRERLDITLPDVRTALQQIRFSKPDMDFRIYSQGTITEYPAASPVDFWLAAWQGEFKMPADPDVLQPMAPVICLSGEEPAEDTENRVWPDTAKPENLAGALGALWERGVGLAWQHFYEPEDRGRISIPPYPFERKRFWLDNIKGAGDLAGAARAMIGMGSEEGEAVQGPAMYFPGWKRLPLTGTFGPGSSGGKRWIIFSDDQGLGDELAAGLKARGENMTILVKKGAGFSSGSENNYTVNPASEQDIRQLISTLAITPDQPIRFVHLWSMDNNGPEAGVFTGFEQAQQQGLFSLLYLVKALGANRLPEDIRIKAITPAVHEVSGTEVLYPQYASVCAILKVIPQEYNGLFCTSIDVEQPQAPGDLAKLAERLMPDLLTDTQDPVVAWRGTYRWIETFERTVLPAEETVQTPFRKDGVYLITGGLGSLGLLLSAFLAGNYQARLILTGRSKFPDRDQWDKLLAGGGEEGLVQKIRQLKAMEEAGARVHILTADSASLHDMQRVMDFAAEQYGQIHGIIHSAGIVDGKTFTSLSEISEDDFRQHFQAKVYGVGIIEQLLEERPLPDFCILMSSLASILGGLGHAAYSVANIFLDSYINLHNRNSRMRWLSVNWETIRTVKEKDAANTLEQLGVNELFMTPDEMLAGFRQILAWAGSGEHSNRILYATGNLEARLNTWIRFKTLAGETAAAQSGTVYERPALTSDYLAPRNETEGRLAELWERFFSIKPVGIEDNFFELGGDSLKAIMLIEKMHKEVNAKIPIAEFFKNPSISGVSAYFRDTDTEEFTAVEKSDRQEHYALSPGQHSMYLLDKINTGSTANNGLFVNEVKGRLDGEKVEAVFRKLIDRHEALRTVFLEIDGQPRQKVLAEAEFRIDYFETDQAGLDNLIAGFVQPFRLDHAPLLRVGLVKLEDDRWIFMMDMHHLIADPVSEEILLGEFIQIYRGAELPPVQMQYRDYVVWQEKIYRSGSLKDQERYWLEQFSSPIPVLNLMTDFPRPDLITGEGDEWHFQISPEQLAALRKLAKAEGVTLYMLLISVYFVFLSRLSMQEDIVIGSPIAGRKHADFEQVIGMFLNMLPIRAYPARDKSFKTFLAEVKELTLASFENQDYPFEYLVDRVVKERDLGRNPVFDTTFTFLQNAHITRQDDETEIGELHFSQYPIPERAVKFDLIFQVEEGEGLQCIFYFRTSLFTRDTIGEFEHFFRKTLEGVLASPQSALKDIRLTDPIPETRKNILLEESGDFGF